ncbi:TPA: hypothetical protein H5X26_004959 [Escherichia coli]|nr:hypothetical protein [Escherichia coli]
MNTFTWAAGGVLVVVLALWSADHASQVKDAALASVDAITTERDRLVDHNRELSGALANQAALQGQLTQISRVTQQLNVDLGKQSGLINRNFEEQKRNDKQIADYLGGAVPAGLGLRYARPQTTDPLAYRAGAASMLPGPVPATGAPGTASQ